MALDVIAASENSGQSQSSVFELSSTDKLIHTAPAGSGFYDLVYVSYVGPRRAKLSFDIQNGSAVSMQSGDVWLDEDEPFLLNAEQSLYLAAPGSSTPAVLVRVERSTPDGATIAVSITTNGDSPALDVPGGTSKDLNVHDTAGADVGTRTGDTVEIADTTVTVNSSAYDTTEAESTLNVEVVDGDDAAVGSLSGGKWVVPDEYFVNITAAEAETTITFTVSFADAGTRTVSAQTLTNGSIDTGGVVVNAAPGVNTFVGVSLSDGDTVELTYTAAGGDFLVELEF